MSSAGSGKRESGREQVLSRIRRGLGATGQDEARRAAVAARLSKRERHLIPSRVAKPAAELKALFRSFLESQSATVIEVGKTEDVPAAIAQYLRTCNLPQRVRVGDDAYLGRLPWSKEPGLTRRHGAAAADDEVGLSHAVSAVAETGTLVLASGHDNPVTLTFLPETHIAVVGAGDIVGPYEAAFERVRATYGEGVMPRTLNFVSGPSRTADVGGRLVMGAHGPRRLCVIIVNDDDHNPS
jgi:L-lactate dehydrogenase complex protein LldG